MSQITNISTTVLKVHPRNTEFFDDIEGDNYTQFKNSIKEDGIITPLIVACDMTIISGHQRYQAAKDLGITQVPVIIREDLEDEDEQLKKLLATNFGRMKNDPNKQRKVAVQYVELCGNSHGGSRGDNRHLQMSQKDIAQNLGVSERTLRELLEIERKLTPEIKELLDSGIISKTSASKIWTKLSETEQEELLHELGKDKIKAMTIKETEQYIENMQKIEDENQALSNQYDELVIENMRKQKEYDDKITKLQVSLNKEIMKKVEVVTEQVDNTDYTRIQKLENELAKTLKEKDDYYSKYSSTLENLTETQKKVNMFMDDSTNFELVKTTSETVSKMVGFVNDMAKYDYLADTFNDLPDVTRKEYMRGVYAVYKWGRSILNQVKHDDVLGVDSSVIEHVEYEEVYDNE